MSFEGRGSDKRNRTARAGRTRTSSKFREHVHETSLCDLHERDVIQTSMVTHTRNPCSALNPSKVHTHTAVNTHTRGAVGSHLCCGAWGAVGVWCLAQGHLVVVLKMERALFIHSTIPAGPRLKLATFRLQVQLSNH